MTMTSSTAGGVRTEAPIPFKRDADVDSDTAGGAALGTVVIALLVCAAVLYLRKRFNLGPVARLGGQRHFRILEIQRLGARGQLAAVEFAGRIYLLAETERGVTTIAATDQRPEEDQ